MPTAAGGTAVVAGPGQLRLLAENKLHHSFGYPLELAFSDTHELIHLLLVNSCGRDLVRRVRLFHALAGHCAECGAILARSPDSELRAHCVELSEYWDWICRLTPGVYKKTCPCVSLCPYSYGFVRPRLTTGPSRSFPLAPWLPWPPARPASESGRPGPRRWGGQSPPVFKIKKFGRSGTRRRRKS